MPTKRLLVSLDEVIVNEIQLLAKLKHTSLSKVGKKLINNSLELHEDTIFSKFADERPSETEEWICHEEVWKINSQGLFLPNYKHTQSKPS